MNEYEQRIFADLAEEYQEKGGEGSPYGLFSTTKEVKDAIEQLARLQQRARILEEEQAERDQFAVDNGG